MAARLIDVQDFSLDLGKVAREAAESLGRGQLLIVPTETVYGIAAKPDVPAAAAKLAELRGDASLPLTPHLPDAAAASSYLGDVSAVGRRLIEKLWPGPVALTFDVAEPRRREVAQAMGMAPALLFGSEGQIVLRCPDEPLTREILRSTQQPVIVSRAGLAAGADANRAPAPQSVPHQVSLILDAGQTRFSKPSTVVRVRGEKWQIVREGIYDRRIIERMLRTSVLFVCSGNTCRSPMAAALARKLIADHIGVSQAELSDRGYDIVSAGTMAMPGMRATPQAADAVAELGGELATHRSQPLTVELINHADVIITMGSAHTEGVLSLVPSAASRTLTLDPEGDVEDPIGLDAEHYRSLAGRIREMIRRRLAQTVLKGL